MSKFVQKFSRQIIASFLLFSLILPNVAQAQLLTNDPILTGQVIMEYIGKLLKVVVKNVVVVGAVQVSQKVAKDAAESVATWVWEGNPGKNPLTYMESPGDYIKKQSEAALSDVLDQMSEDVANANLLCVSDPTAALGVLGGIYAALKDKANVKPFGNQPGSSQFSPTPELNLGKCDAGSIALNYQNLTNELSSDELLKRFSNAATGGGSEIDQIVSAQMNALTSIIREQKNAETARLATKSYRDQTSLISGDVIQSSDAVAEDAKTNTAKFQQEQESRQLAGILASGAEAIPSIFATTFANALSKKIIDKLKRGKGTNPANTSVNLSNIFGAGSKNVGNSSAGALYSDTKTAIISEGELDLLSSFAACPDKFNGIDNCVIDEGFASAIRTADAGKALTVREALDQDRLHANFEMVPPAKQALNESRLCAKSAYCFSNLAKLRKARVIPIGWEIAAASADGTGKTTLGAVVAGFNQCTYVCSNDAAKTCKTDSDCGKGNTCTPTRTKETPFCHLIDPNWVLKMPEQICRAKVYGPQLQSELGPDRQEVCSDQASCLAENSSGQCIGAYGYCLREKNTFRFEADECPAQFAGCRTYGNKVFGNISLLDATIDSGSCTDKNTGCMGYYADYLPTGVIDTNSPKVYLNDKAASCNVENIGCTEVQNAVSGKQQFLRLPPAGMGCKGYANDPSACSQYAAACTVDEVGCEVYQPVGSSDPVVPGVITAATKDTSGNVVAWNDECAAECVGYSSYYEAPTPIEPIAAVATAFIPKSATMCTQDVVGCDAYLNVDTAAKGAGTTAYFAQPQKCSDPENNTNHSIYYSWEGSDQAGYQLRQHDLVMEADGKTPLLDVPKTQLAAVAAECTAAKYIARITADGKPDPLFNTDCRELFDKGGVPYYRLISKTLPSSPNCVAFRKDTPDEANCTASNGKFDKESGSCEYGFLPSASTQCKATEVGCRAYAGAAALSPKTVLNDSFATEDGWSGADLSNEGITVGDTVLKFTGANTAHTVSLAQNKTYNTVFWAKGQGSINVSFVSGGTTLKLNTEPIVVSLEWRRFEVSSAPVPFTDESAKLVFEKTVGSAIYLENLVVKEQLDVVYAIKNSWNTPLSCDAIPGDNIPGPALNCRVYKPKSQTNAPQVYLTGFTGLCREQSAGCQKFVSTQNTVQITEKQVSFGTAKRTILADDFVYVIANSKASCPADKKGCSALGMKVGDKIETVAKINNPDDYANSSCEIKDEWCQTFTMPGGTQRYFKYPDAEKQCEYKEGVETGGTKYTGWFKKGTTKPCYDSFVTGGNQYGIFKNKDGNFTGMSGLCQPEFNQCTEFIDHADVSRENPVGHPYYFMNNNRLDTTSCSGKVSLKEGCVLLENTDAIADTTYSTLATYCKSDAANDAQCSGIDGILSKAGVAAADQGKDGVSVAPIVGINKDKISMCKTLQTNGVFVATDCDSQLAKWKASGKTTTYACDNKTGVDEIKKLIDAERVVCATVPDSNTVVKVRRDRTCAEWLSCQSSISVYDKSSQKFKDVCTALGVCNKLSTDSGAVGQCANWVTPQQMSGPEKIQRALPLTTSRYVSRNVGWYGHEFSGYSLWKKFQPDTVGQFSESVNSPSMKVGVGFVATGSSGCKSSSDIGISCIADVFSDESVKKQITDEFGAVDFNGQCFEQKCWYPIDGFKTETVDYTKSTCRGYPEVDSPFPQSVVENTNLFGVVNKTAQGFKSANICERYVAEKPMRTNENWATFDDYVTSEGRSAPYILTLENGPCECSYKKVTYGQMGDDKYYALKETSAEMAVGKSVFVKELGAAWIKGTVTSFDGGLYKVVSENNQSLTITDPNKIAFIDGDKTKLVAGKNVVALNNDGKWYSAKVDKGGSNIKTTVQYLNSGLTDEDVKALLGIMPSYSSISAQPILDKLDTITKNYPTLLSSIDSIRGHILKVIDAFKKRNAAIEKLKKNLGDSALITDITKNAITGQKLNDAVYNAAKVKYGNGFTAAWESFIEPLVTIIISETKIIDSNLTSASGKIIALGASSKSAGSSVVDTFTGLAVIGHLSNNADAPIGICDGGWFVVGSKKSPNPDAISKTGLSCTRDFDCIDERLLTLKDPKAIAGSVKDEDKESDESGYSYQYSNEDGKCQFKKKETSVYGWEGYCLEKDLSSHINNSTKENPCLTWLPIDVAGSDVYNQYTSAGYSIDPDGSGKYYCAENRGRLNGDKNAENRYSYQIGNISFLVTGTKEKGLLDTLKEFVVPDLGLEGALSDKGELNNLIDDKAYRGYKSYDISSVTGKLPELYASEIDFIELEAVNNSFFPDGYTMKIRNDGKATIYQNTSIIDVWKNKDAYKSMVCPAWTVNDAGLAGYDYLDPDNQYSKPLQQDKIILEPLSYLIRGPEDYYQTGKTIGDYFTCRGSENKDLVYPVIKSTDALTPSPMAITGVMRNGVDKNGDLYSVGLKDKDVGQIWFLRIDNQKYRWWHEDQKNHIEFDRRAFQLGDIVSKNHSDKVIALSPALKNGYRTCQPFKENTTEKYIELVKQNAEQIGYQLRFKFDKDGKFDGIDSASCTQREDATIYAGWKIKVHVRDACMKVAQTVDDKGKNAAFTHRLWTAHPAGFAKAEDSTVVLAKNLIVATKGLVPSLNKYGSFAVQIAPDYLWYTYAEDIEKTAPGFKTNLIGGTTAKGYSCPNGTNCLLNSSGFGAGKILTTDGEAALKSLFAKIYVSYSSSVGLETKKYTASSVVIDNTEDGAVTPPVIFALDQSTCGGVRGGTCTMTKKYGMTVNGVYDDGDTVFGKGSVAATVRFYGYADQNQMPIKRITIDWADKSAILQKSGEYRNHKPVCSTQQTPVAVCKSASGNPDYNHVCVTNKDCESLGVGATCLNEKKDLKWAFGSWGGDGNSDEGACEPSYFQFTHAYTFTPNCGDDTGNTKAKIATADEITKYKLEGKIGIGERFCVFKPRVQLLDNWNACNGNGQGYAGKDSDKKFYLCDSSDITDYSTPFQGNIIVKE